MGELEWRVCGVVLWCLRIQSNVSGFGKNFSSDFLLSGRKGIYHTDQTTSAIPRPTWKSSLGEEAGDQ